MDLFYKIHLQAFNVISIVLYQCGPTFGKVLCSCLDAFVVVASDYSGHLIRHHLNASEAFPTVWFLQFWEQVKVWWAEPTRLRLFQNVMFRLRITRYGMDGPEIEFRWEARFSAPVQTGPGAHPATCTMGTGSSPGGEAAGVWR
jgi:hypothetical protein